MSQPIHDHQAEREVLGALMVTDAINGVVSETQIKPEHFYAERHRLIFRAMVGVADSGREVDVITVRDELGSSLADAGGIDYLNELASTVAAAGNVLHHAAIVVEKARWRGRRKAGLLITQAAQDEDAEALAQAEALLTDEAAEESEVYDEERQAELLWEMLEGAKAPEFTWPFEGLNRACGGGMGRGQLHILAGYTGEGKSQIASMCLDANRKRGKSVALYDNEMTPSEQVARRTTRALGIPAHRLTSGKLSADEKRDVLAKISTIPGWPIVSIFGKSAEEVCRHIRLMRWDFVVVDILHNFRFKDERELSAIVSLLKSTAGQANCCILAVAHINRGGLVQGKRRPPTRHDLRWSGDLENLAHTVTFVYREQDYDYDPPKTLPSGNVYFDKNRSGPLISVPVWFNEKRLRFEVQTEGPDEVLAGGDGW